MKLYRINPENVDPRVKEVLSTVGEATTMDFFRTNTCCQVFLTTERGKMHISISHKHRYPSYEEIKAVKYALLPDKVMAQIFPKKEDFVNVHENTFHLFEIGE